MTWEGNKTITYKLLTLWGVQDLWLRIKVLNDWVWRWLEISRFLQFYNFPFFRHAWQKLQAAGPTRGAEEDLSYKLWSTEVFHHSSQKVSSSVRPFNKGGGGGINKVSLNKYKVSIFISLEKKWMNKVIYCRFKWYGR